ncbi:CU044_5270 family protein [Kitasatospora purpeofusca]|uniref:CU044_5270 family protein n=1 Tax=Kitasatospora purpeofusca TaxID=67352 RepID=UPI0035DC742F
MSTAKRVREMMVAGDPAAVELPDRAEAEAALEMILGDAAGRQVEDPPRRSRPRRLVLALAAAATVSAVVTALLVLPGGSGSAAAATPAPLAYHLTAEQTATDARTQLLQIARTARSAGETPVTPLGLHWQQWSLNTRDDRGKVTSRVVPYDCEVLNGPTGLVVRRRSLGGSEKTRTDPFHPTLQDVGTPQDGQSLRDWLRRRTPGVDGPGGASQAVHDLLVERALTGGQRAAVLELIASLPGLEVTGTVTDRAGRVGVAYSASSKESGLPTRYTFIIDPGTGRVLAQEETLTETAGLLNVPIPSVTSYNVYLGNAG